MPDVRSSSDRQNTLIALLAGTLLCVGCLSLGCTSIPVTTDFDPAFDFPTLKRYALFEDPTLQDGDLRTHNSLTDQRVRTAIEREMEASGFVRVSPDDADFLISHHIGIESGIDVRTIHNTHRYSRRSWSGSRAGRGMSTRSHTIVREYERGTLLIDILAPPDLRLVWRGSSSARMRDRSTPEARAERINRGVAEILGRFPPN